MILAGRLGDARGAAAEGRERAGGGRPDEPTSAPARHRDRRHGLPVPGARDLFAYWDNVLAGRDCIREVPRVPLGPGRLLRSRPRPTTDRVVPSRGATSTSRSPSTRPRHGIMPRTVEGGEPEQFLVLDAARAALADAGLPDGPADGRRVEVVVGRGNYFNRGNLTRLQHGRISPRRWRSCRPLHPEWAEADLEAVRADLKASLPPFEAATIPGQLTNATAGRVGPPARPAGASYVVDAASASSLVALDLGARALVERRADLALVGGVYLEADVDFPMVFSPARRAVAIGPVAAVRRPTPTGWCPARGWASSCSSGWPTPSATATGSTPSSRGSAWPATAAARGLAAPDARGHLRAIRRAYRRGGDRPGDRRADRGARPGRAGGRPGRAAGAAARPSRRPRAARHASSARRRR